jgi:hypothetical protein
MLTSVSMSVISIALQELPLYCVYLWHINQHLRAKCRLNLQNCKLKALLTFASLKILNGLKISNKTR